jgi:hypothetical protein
LNVKILLLLVFSLHIDAHMGDRGGGGRVNIGPPLANFNRLVNKNAIELTGNSPESLDPPTRDFGKNLSYPLP